MQDKLNPFTISKVDFDEMIQSDHLMKTIQQTLQGFSKDSARELYHLLSQNNVDDFQVYQDFLNAFERNNQPTITLTDQKDYFYKAFPYQSLKGSSNFSNP